MSFYGKFRAGVHGVSLFVGLMAAPAYAAPLTPIEILDQFNLVTFGDVDSTSEVEGRALIGGDLKGPSSTYFTRPVSPSAYGALTVGGNVIGGYKNVNNSGKVVVGGNVENMNLNGGSAQIGGSITGNVNGNKQTGVAVVIPDFEVVMTEFSGNLATLTANSGIVKSGNKATFAATPDSDGMAVFSITDGSSFFNSIGEIDFSLNSADTLIINVSGLTMTISENFLGGIGATIASKTIWNFFEAEEINFGAEFFGTVLAPKANISNQNSLNGSVIVQNFFQRGEVHVASFTGDVPSFNPDPGPGGSEIPAPGALAIFILSGLGLAAARRRA